MINMMMFISKTVIFQFTTLNYKGHMLVQSTVDITAGYPACCRCIKVVPVAIPGMARPCLLVYKLSPLCNILLTYKWITYNLYKFHYSMSTCFVYTYV